MHRAMEGILTRFWSRCSTVAFLTLFHHRYQVGMEEKCDQVTLQHCEKRQMLSLEMVLRRRLDDLVMHLMHIRGQTVRGWRQKDTPRF